ncbi:MAG TPA: ABC transporter substrate-binding protein [bacterium]
MSGIPGRVVAVGIVMSLLGVSAPPTLGARVDVNTLIVGMNTSILITLDPGVVYEVEGAVIVDQLYDKLVDMEMVKGTIQIVPKVAQTWAASADGKTWTFTIRQGMRFPSGRAVNAAAVVYSLRRAVRLAKTPAWLLEQLGFTKDNADQTIRALDDYTVQLVLADAFAPNLVLSVLAFPITGVVDPDLVQQHITEGDLGSDWLKDHSAGSGPYTLIRWERNEVVDLVANPTYWRGIPPVKRIMVRDIPESTAQRLAVEKGDIDVAWNMSPQMREEIRKQKTPGVDIVQIPAHGIAYVGMNVKYEPLSKDKVREAIRWAIDYDAILRDVLRGEAIPLQTFIPTGYLGYNPSRPFTQDLTKAKQLLAEAGYPNGFEVELTTSSPHPTRPDIAQLIQSNLAKVGIKVKIVLMASGVMYQKFREQGLQMILASWGVDYPDPDALAKPFADGTVKQLAWRNAWMDKDATELTKRAMLERDADKRVALYRQLTDLVLHKGAFAIIYQPTDTWVVRTWVKGYADAAALGTMHFDFTKVSKVRE